MLQVLSIYCSEIHLAECVLSKQRNTPNHSAFQFSHHNSKQGKEPFSQNESYNLNFINNYEKFLCSSSVTFGQQIIK